MNKKGLLSPGGLASQLNQWDPRANKMSVHSYAYNVVTVITDINMKLHSLLCGS